MRALASRTGSSRRRFPNDLVRAFSSSRIVLETRPSPQDWPELRGSDQDGAARDVPVFREPFSLRVAGAASSARVIRGSSPRAGRVVGAFSGVEHDHVVALDLESGDELWRAPLGPRFPGTQGAEDGPTSTPCIFEERVFAPGPRGRLVALDLGDGRERWSTDLVRALRCQTWARTGSERPPFPSAA